MDTTRALEPLLPDAYLRTCQRRRPEHAAALAAVLARLLLKRVHRPAAAPGYRRCADRFLEAYTVTAPRAGLVDGPELCALTGALLLARVHGASPAEYLDARGRARVSWLADRVLEGPVEEVGALWRTADEACA